MSNKYLFSFSFVLFVFGGIFLSTGCADDASEIPSFIRIDTITVDSVDYTQYGSTRHKINFTFVYIDDNFQGAYLLPAKFPVIGEGVKKIAIYAGVAEFGNGSTITRYMFYEPYVINDTLVLQDTLPLAPHVQYDTLPSIVYHVEDFDATFGSDFVLTSSNGNYISNYPDTDPDAEGLCGYMYMGADTAGTQCIIESGTPITVPKGAVGYFLEIDYKCNAPFFFDMKTSTGYRSIIGFNTKTTWNKAYINITYAMDVTPGTDVKLVFKMNRDVNIPNQEVLIDNIKLIYLP
jgi:hypothetical protein